MGDPHRNLTYAAKVIGGQWWRCVANWRWVLAGAGVEDLMDKMARFVGECKRVGWGHSNSKRRSNNT